MVLSKIVVGVDGGPGEVDALALARRLAPPGSTVVAVAIALAGEPPGADVTAAFERAAREEAQERLADLRAREPGLQTEVVAAPDVAEGLHTAATRLGADLLVVGSCRRGLVGRIFLGDDTRQTLRHAPCPVAVATHDYALTDAPITSVGLGWAPKGSSDGALHLAEDLARALGAQLHALTTVRASYLPEAEGTTTAQENEVKMADAAAAFNAVSAGEVHAMMGVAIDELLAFAAEVDVLVVGAGEHGPLQRLVAGDTAEQLARRTTRPLIVVPHVRDDIAAGAGVA